MLLIHERARELVGLLSKKCKSLDDVQNMLKSLFKGTIEEMLGAEMNEHLGYEKHSIVGNNSGNSRNGYNKKIIQSQLGKSEIRIPQERNDELKSRGMQDILIACRDNLSGFSAAIETAIPKAEQQLCVIHQIRNSTKYVSYKNIKAVKKSVYLPINKITKK